MVNKNKLKEIYERMSTPEERVLDILENIEQFKGEKGDDGRDGRDGREGPLGPQGMQGPQGRTGPQGPQGKAGKNGVDGKNGKDGNEITAEQIVAKMDTVKNGQGFSVLKLKDLEWIRGKDNVQWSSAGFKVYTDSTLTGDGSSANPLHAVAGGGAVSQIVAGTNVTISPAGGTGVVTINVTGGGGGTGYQAPLSGGLTGTNTCTSAPSVIVIDGVPRQKTQTDGTSMWTGTTTTVLTANCPKPTFDIFACA